MDTVPKEMKIAGNCSFCRRLVGADMRPINELKDLNLTFPVEQPKARKKATPKRASRASAKGSRKGSSREEVEGASTSTSVADKSDSESQQGSNPDEEQPEFTLAEVTSAMLQMVNDQFERNPSSESLIPNDHAELVLTMLIEEQNTYERFLKNTEAAKKGKSH